MDIQECGSIVAGRWTDIYIYELYYRITQITGKPVFYIVVQTDDMAWCGPNGLMIGFLIILHKRLSKHWCIYAIGIGRPTLALVGLKKACGGGRNRLTEIMMNDYKINQTVPMNIL